MRLVMIGKTRQRIPFLFAAVLVFGGSIFAAQTSPQTAVTRVYFTTSDGQGGVIAGTRPHLYTPDILPNVFVPVRSTNARTSDGLVISGFSIYCWSDGDGVRVVLLAAVPPEGKESRFYEVTRGDSFPSMFQFSEIGRYTMVHGDKRHLDEMKAVGVEPMILRAEGR